MQQDAILHFYLFTYARGLSADRNCPCVKYPKDKPPRLSKIIITVNPEVPLFQHKAQLQSILQTRCGMVKDATLVTVAVHRLVCHGSIEMS